MRDLAAPEARLKANEHEAEQVEGTIGADYQALLSGDGVAEGA